MQPREARQRNKLPLVVRAYAQRAAESAPPRRVRIEQHGELRLSPSGRWKPFQAAQEYAAERSFFAWHATVKLAPAVKIDVLDRLDDAQGTLDVRFLGARIQHASGEAVAMAQRIRYLAELVWNPGAFTLHPDLMWRDLNGRRVMVSCASQPEGHQADLHFDGHGDPACVTAIRPRLEATGTTLRPWAAHMWQYSALEGLRIPLRAEARWDLPSGPFVYWRAAIVGLQVLD